jgi:hypothetical protein
MKGSSGHSNTHFSKCVKLELTIRQSFAKPRRIWGSNFSGEGKDQASLNMEERGTFYRRGWAAPRGVASQGEPLLLFMVLFIVVTPSSWW